MRLIPLETDAQRRAVLQARTQVSSRDGHMGDPARNLKRNLRRFDYVLEKFGITERLAAGTSHGLRHGNLNNLYEDLTGVPSPVRGGGTVPADLVRAAQLAGSR